MQIIRYKQFVSDFKKIKLSDTQFNKFIHFTYCLQNDQTLPKEAKDHALKGEYQNYREFHLGGDMLIIYKQVDKNTIIYVRIGTHAQLFK